MKKIANLSFLGAGALMIVAGTAFAASAGLYNGGLGQVASNPDQFGVAVCNRGPEALTQAVPLDLAANGQTAEISSASSIAPGQCQYSYLDYSALGLAPNGEYSVAVTVNNNDKITYDVTVPANASNGASATANIDQQVGNIFTNFWKWLVSLF